MVNRPSNTVQIAVTSSSKHLEGNLTAALAFPGYLVERVTNKTTFRPHTTAQGAAQPLIVTENIYQGTTFTGDITTDDSYATGQHIYVRYGRPGDVFLMTAGGVVAFGALVASAGNGRVIVAGATQVDGYIVGKALTAAAATGDYIEVEIA